MGSRTRPKGENARERLEQESEEKGKDGKMENEKEDKFHVSFSEQR